MRLLRTPLQILREESGPYLLLNLLAYGLLLGAVYEALSLRYIIPVLVGAS